MRSHVSQPSTQPAARWTSSTLALVSAVDTLSDDHPVSAMASSKLPVTMAPGTIPRETLHLPSDTVADADVARP